MNLKEGLVEVNNKGVNYLCYQKLNDLGVVNAFSLKGLNFRNREGVEKDYQILMDSLGLEYKNLVKPLANHTDNILIIEKKQNQNTADINLPYLNQIDGVITSKSNIALATTSADCLCIILYDPVRKVLANVHSGWRGTFQKIVQKTLRKMKQELNCNAENVLCFLMPAIRQCHFEVDEDVMLKCKEIFEYTGQMENVIHIGRKIDDLQKYHIDNIFINKILLEEEGVLSENIFDSELCTVCHRDKMHSRRADGEHFGIATTIAMMKE